MIAKIGTFSYILLVRVECTPSDMLVHLNLAREFRGRVYATGNPQACFELGGGLSEMTLRIPLGTQCGTVQQVGNYQLFHFSMSIQDITFIMISFFFNNISQNIFNLFYS